MITTIPGTAVAKGRPRMNRKGFAYTPAKTRRHEAHGRLAAQGAMADCAPIALPVVAAEETYARAPKLALTLAPLPSATANGQVAA
jgi:hypothetical protein